MWLQDGDRWFRACFKSKNNVIFKVAITMNNKVTN